MTEREKLQSWRIFLGGCEQEFAKALRDLSLMPPHHRAHAEETIQELTASLRIVREGPQENNSRRSFKKRCIAGAAASRRLKTWE